MPIFLFHKEFPYEIGKFLGKLVKVDGYTLKKSKLLQANVCIELDVPVELPSHVWINVLDTGKTIRVKYNKVPPFCTHCKKLGHVEMKCFSKERRVELVQKVVNLKNYQAKNFQKNYQ